MPEKENIEQENPFGEDQEAFDDVADFIFGVSGDEIAGRSYEIGGDAPQMWDEDMAGWHALRLRSIEDNPKFVSSKGENMLYLELSWDIISLSDFGLTNPNLVHPDKMLPLDDDCDGMQVNFDNYYIKPKTFYIFNELCKALRIPYKESDQKTKKGEPIKIWLFSEQTAKDRCCLAKVVSGTKGERQDDGSYKRIPSGFPEIEQVAGRRNYVSLINSKWNKTESGIFVADQVVFGEPIKSLTVSDVKKDDLPFD